MSVLGDTVKAFDEKAIASKYAVEAGSPEWWLRAAKRTEDRFWSNVDKSAGDDGCWNWTRAKFHYGHGATTVVCGKLAKQFHAHRLAWAYVHNEPVADNRDGKFLLHSCDNPSCVNPKHLRFGTQKENMQDRVDRGRSGKGESNPRNKITEATAIHILHLFRSGVKTKAIVEQTGVSKRAVQHIIYRTGWKHLP